jgi:hypothetical protein
MATNPIITNVAVVSREAQAAIASHCTVDGATIPADAALLRGTLLVRSAVGGKFHVFVHGTDVLAADMVRILKDDKRLSAGLDAMAAAYVEGFFKLSALLDANPGLVAADLTVAAGFHMIEVDEVRLK